MPATMTVKGLAEVRHAFRVLPKVAANRVVRKALREGAKVLAAEVVRDVPRGTGALAKDVKVRAAAKKRRGVIGLEVRLGGGNYKGRSFYGAFVNFGTKAQKAQHFMERAFDSASARALDVTRAEIGAGIRRELSR